MTGELRLGFDPDFAPLTYVDRGRPAGRALEIVRAACARAGIALELVPVGLDTRDAGAELRLDGFACMAITPGRTAIAFSAAYMRTAAALFVARRPGEREQALRSDGVAVITPRGGPLFGLLSEKIGEGNPEPGLGSVTVTRIVPGMDYRDCLNRVLGGEADAAALNAEVGRTMVARLFPDKFVELPAPLPDLGLAVALTCPPSEASHVLARLDLALATTGAEGPATGPAPVDHP